MLRALILSKPMLAFLKGLPAKQYRQVVSKTFDLLSNPRPNDAGAVKGRPDLLRVDIGEYRIAYAVTDEAIKIYAVGKRNDDEVYRLLNRKT